MQDLKMWDLRWDLGLGVGLGFWSDAPATRRAACAGRTRRRHGRLLLLIRIASINIFSRVADRRGETTEKMLLTHLTGRLNFGFSKKGKTEKWRAATSQFNEDFVCCRR